MTSRSTSALTIAGVTVVGGILAYAVYFDYKRRNDADFRKKLRMSSSCFLSLDVALTFYLGKEKKRVNKSLAQSKESLADSSSLVITPAVLREALEQVKNEPRPAPTDDQESYFMSQVGMGEQLATQGPFHFFFLAFPPRLTVPTRPCFLPPGCDVLLQGTSSVPFPRRTHCDLPKNRARAHL